MATRAAARRHPIAGLAARLDGLLPTDAVEHMDEPGFPPERRTAELDTLDRWNHRLGSYARFASARSWADDPSGDPILLHIDMDYFNNRYDGDSEWQLREPRLDPELPQMLSKALAARRYVVSLEEQDTCSYVPLPATWDAYLGTLKKKKRLVVMQGDRKVLEYIVYGN